MEYVGGEWILNTPKTATSSRDIPASKEHLLEIKKYGESRRHQKSMKKAEGMKIKTGDGAGAATGETDLSGFVSISHIGHPFIGVAVSKKMKTIVDRMKMEGLLDRDECYTFHSLRHSFGSNGLSRGMTVKTVSELMGHSDRSITLEIYTHITEEQKREEMKRSGMLDGDDSKPAA